jgi:hypothetical protein
VACHTSGAPRFARTHVRLAAKLFATLWLACTVVPAGAQEEKILIQSLPANVDKTTALKFAREALEYREWTIVKEEADSVEAKISRNAVNAKIRIRHNGNQLVYEDSARGKAKVDFTGRTVPSITEAPARWINYLRSDITEKVQAHASAASAGAPDVAPAKPPAKAPATVAAGERARKRGNGVERMQELKEMFDRGLISADEYTRKKEQILNEM